MVDPAVPVVPHRGRGLWEALVPPATKHSENPLMKEDRIWDVRWDDAQPTTNDAEAKVFRMW